MRTVKQGFRSLISSILTDLVMLAFQRWVLGAINDITAPDKPSSTIRPARPPSANADLLGGVSPAENARDQQAEPRTLIFLWNLSLAKWIQRLFTRKRERTETHASCN